VPLRRPIAFDLPSFLTTKTNHTRRAVGSCQPAGPQQSGSTPCHLCLSCTCSDSQPGRGSLTRHPCQLSSDPSPSLAENPTTVQTRGLWKNSVSFCLAGRLIIRASSKRLHPTVIEVQSCGPVGSRSSSHTLMHSARAKPAVRKYQTSTVSPRPCCSIPRRSRQLARHNVEMVLSSLNLQGQSRGSVI
jgi:hypothetical protein